MLGRSVFLAALLIAGAACAADLSSPGSGALRPGSGALRPGFAPELPPAAFSWTGIHFGVNFGADLGTAANIAISGNDAVRAAVVASGERPARASIGGRGLAGGAQIGFDQELRSPFGFGDAALVVGVETDIAGTAVGGNSRYSSDRASVFAARTDTLGTLRARVGYASGRLLVYATGGFAYGRTRDATSFLNPAGRQTYAGASDTIRTGYVAGGGIEAALPGLASMPVLTRLGGDLTARLELLHYELGGGPTLVSNLDGVDPGYTQRTRDSGTLVRAGLNLKLGGIAAGPVVARY